MSRWNGSRFSFAKFDHQFSKFRNIFLWLQKQKKRNYETFQPWYFLPDPTPNPQSNWKKFLVSTWHYFTYFKITSFLLQRPMHKSWEQRRKLSRVDPCFNSIVFWKKLQRSHFMYSGKINEFCQIHRFFFYKLEAFRFLIINFPWYVARGANSFFRISSLDQLLLLVDPG